MHPESNAAESEFSEVKGQYNVKRAVEVAAAGPIYQDYDQEPRLAWLIVRVRLAPS